MQTRSDCQIAITGIGLCSPLGPDRESSWQKMQAGDRGARWLSTPHWPDSTRMAGAPVCLPARPFHSAEPLINLALITAEESLQDAGLSRRNLSECVVGVVYGNSKGGLHTYSRLAQLQRERSTDEISECDQQKPSHDWLDFLPNRSAVAIASLIGGYGPIHCPVAACATGLAACIRGAQMIRNGDCDVVLAGSADVSLQPALLGSFRRLGVLSREDQDASLACRPFDRKRSGFVVGEGAACLVMERMSDAKARGASLYAEWIDGLILSDGFEMTQLDPEAATLQNLLRTLWSKTGAIPDHINLHGTGTLTNDRVECHAVQRVFGLLADQISGCSLKGGLGHLLGAAGSVELAVTAMSIRDQIVPPTVNLSEQDPDCGLNLIAGSARKQSIHRAWKISMGFGGHVAGACLGRIE